MAYWLFKSEPDCFSFADLLAQPRKTTGWDGVRNYLARNRLRDEAKKGDGVLFHHSNGNPPAIAGIAEIVKEAHADPTAFDPSEPHYDPKSNPACPTWLQVSIRGVKAIDPPITLSRLREDPALAQMELLQKGSRLSIQKVRPQEWARILEIAAGSR